MHYIERNYKETSKNRLEMCVAKEQAITNLNKIVVASFWCDETIWWTLESYLVSQSYVTGFLVKNVCVHVAHANPITYLCSSFISLEQTLFLQDSYLCLCLSHMQVTL